MSKGNDTRSQILQQALELSSEVGLEGVTIGVLAKLVGMSKSGLYAHFTSKEDLQSQVLDAAADRFVNVILSQVLKQPRGLPRVRALFEQWLDWYASEFSGGCPFIAAAYDFDDRPGPVRDRLVAHLRDILGTIAQAARISVEEGHFQPDLDAEQFAFELWSITLAFHHYSRLLHQEDARKMANQAFAKLIRSVQSVQSE